MHPYTPFLVAVPPISLGVLLSTPLGLMEGVSHRMPPITGHVKLSTQSWYPGNSDWFKSWAHYQRWNDENHFLWERSLFLLALFGRVWFWGFQRPSFSPQGASQCLQTEATHREEQSWELRDGGGEVGKGGDGDIHIEIRIFIDIIWALLWTSQPCKSRVKPEKQNQ